MLRKNFGFTLAEVLIVIGIIGVVAALTLPNLNHATGDKETVTRVKKALSALSDANDRAVVIYSDLAGWGTQGSCGDNVNVCYINRIGEFLKVQKTCTKSPASGEGQSAVAAVNCEAMIAGSMASNSDSNGKVLQLGDGMTVTATGWNSSNCGNAADDACLTLVFDIDGAKKGKNLAGYDQFSYDVHDRKGVAKDYSTPSAGLSACKSNGWNCAYWINTFDNVDYNKTTEGTTTTEDPDTGEDVEVGNGVYTCKDSSIVLDGTTNTSCH